MIPIPLLKWGVAGLLVAAFGAWCWTGGAAHKQKEFDLYKGEQAKAALLESEKARATEQALQRKVDDANTSLQAERAKHARVAAGLRAELGGLRDSISVFTSAKPDDTATSLSERCATTGSLLEEALRTSEACAIEGEQVAADLRAVLTAWPKQDR